MFLLIFVEFKWISVVDFALRALTLLVGRQKELPACKN